jgi:hypothetical protein
VWIATTTCCTASTGAIAATPKEQFTIESIWFITKDGDRSVLALYERHYSCYRYRDGRRRVLFCGPGEKIVLRTDAADAAFVWRRFIDRSGQQGVNCAFFRNESRHLSSELIRQADAIADASWPGQRHYTYVDPQKVRSKRDPGWCFLVAGWQKCGFTKGGLLILHRPPPPAATGTTNRPAAMPGHGP